MRLTKLLTAITILIVSMTGSGFGESTPPPHYHLKVRIDPALNLLEAEATVQMPPETRFYLHQGFTVREIFADGEKTPFHQDFSDDSSLQRMLGTPTVMEAGIPRELRVRYSGGIEGTPFECNMVTPELVELAIYSAWYPLFRNTKSFTFEMETDLPAGFAVTTNGRMEDQQRREERSITRWTSYGPGFDIVIVASPGLRKTEKKNNGTHAEVLYARLPEHLLKPRIDSLLEGMEWLTNLYGPPRLTGALRLVYSPRSGQGYSRMPLIVVSEERALGWLSQEYGETLDYRYNYHEAAHFWWMLSDTDTPDDWINEGLAEYTAFRLCERRFGKAYSERRIGEYRRNAVRSRTTDSIAETKGSSPDREVNRYDKSALMFLEARERFGEERLDRFLKALYDRFGENPTATTALFLEETKKQMGSEAEGFFREALYRKGETGQSTPLK